MTPSLDPAALAPDPGDARYHLTVEGFPASAFPVDTWTGREALSEPYAFDVVVTATSDADEELEQHLLGRRASFVWKHERGERAFYGVLAAVRLARVHETAPRSVQLHLRLVPRLWLLKRRKRSRIFQQLRVPEIVEAVLESGGIGARWQLLREHPARDYVTQYEESDLAFVKRLCAEEGIFFHFPTGAPLDAAPEGAVIPGDTVVFADDASFYPPIGGDDPAALGDTPDAKGSAISAEAPSLFHLTMEETNSSHADKVTHFSARTVVKATATAFRDFDPERPMARPGSVARLPEPSTQAPAAYADAPAGLELEVYEHHSAFLFPRWAWAADEAALVLRQKRRRAATAQGESGCADLAPGHKFLRLTSPSRQRWGKPDLVALGNPVVGQEFLRYAAIHDRFKDPP